MLDEIGPLTSRNWQMPNNVLLIQYFFCQQDLYQRFLDGDESVKNIPLEEDPFWEPPEDVLIGTANVFLQSLSYALDFDDKLMVTDYKVM